MVTAQERSILSNRAGLVLFGVALWSACASPPEQITRFITDEPEADFDASAFAATKSVASWEFNGPDDLAEWRALSIDKTLEASAEGLLIRSSSRDPKLVRSVLLAAERIDGIEIIAAGAELGPPHVFWAREGEAFTGARGRAPTVALPLDDGETLFRFELGSLEAWQGEIRRLRVDPTSIADQEVRIRRISAVSYHATPELQVALTRPWRIERDQELRSVWLAPPGQRVSRRLVVPREGQLRFGFGRWDGLRLSTAQSPQPQSQQPQVVRDPLLRVLIDAGGGGEPEVVFEAILDRGDGAARVWQDAVVDLSRFVGLEVEITLECASMGAGETTAAMGLWAHPEVGPGRRPQGTPNLVLVSIDTLRGDRLSLNGHQRATTPAIDSWAARSGINFRNTVAAAPWRGCAGRSW